MSDQTARQQQNKKQCIFNVIKIQFDSEVKKRQAGKMRFWSLGLPASQLKKLGMELGLGQK